MVLGGGCVGARPGVEGGHSAMQQHIQRSVTWGDRGGGGDCDGWGRREGCTMRGGGGWEEWG